MRIKKSLLVLCCLLLIYFLGGIVYSFIPKDKFIKKKKVNTSLTIKGYDYILNEDKLDIYKDEFKVLKKNLESTNVDFKEYANSISKMFIIDLYSLDNKKNMYDVGGVEFVYPKAQENYKLNVQNTLYKYMRDNSDGKRKQELPTVKSVEIVSTEENKFKIEETEYEGYKIKLKIEYEKDLEYDKEAEIILIKDKKYLYIVEKN